MAVARYASGQVYTCKHCHHSEMRDYGKEKVYLIHIDYPIDDSDDDDYDPRWYLRAYRVHLCGEPDLSIEGIEASSDDSMVISLSSLEGYSMGLNRFSNCEDVLSDEFLRDLENSISLEIKEWVSTFSQYKTKVKL